MAIPIGWIYPVLGGTVDSAVPLRKIVSLVFHAHAGFTIAPPLITSPRKPVSVAALLIPTTLEMWAGLVESARFPPAVTATYAARFSVARTDITPLATAVEDKPPNTGIEIF